MVTLMIRHSTLPLKISMIWFEEILLWGWRKILNLKDLYVLWCWTKVLIGENIQLGRQKSIKFREIFNTRTVTLTAVWDVW